MTTVLIRTHIHNMEDMQCHIMQHTKYYLVAVVVHNEDIWDCNTAPVLEILSLLKPHVSTMHGSIYFCFEGYEDAVRPLEKIPEIVAFYRKLQHEMPELLIFIRGQMPGEDPRFNELRTLTRMAVSDELHLLTDGVSFFASNGLMSRLQEYFVGVDRFFKANNTSPELMSEIHNNLLTRFWYLKEFKEL